jgi:hypothetical protein
LEKPIVNAVRHLRQMGSGMTDYGCGRCDGHHEMVDFTLS